MRKAIAVLLIAVTISASLISCQSAVNLGKNLGETVVEFGHDVEDDVKKVTSK